MSDIFTEIVAGSAYADVKGTLVGIAEAAGGDGAADAVTTWGDMRTLLNSAATALGLSTIANSEPGSDVRPKLNALRERLVIPSAFADDPTGFWYNGDGNHQASNGYSARADDATEAIGFSPDHRTMRGKTFAQFLAGQTELISGSFTLTPVGSGVVTESPTGTYNITGDGSNQSSINKTISGLTIGDTYLLEFDVASSGVGINITAAGQPTVTAVPGVGADQRMVYKAATISIGVQFYKVGAVLTSVSNVSLKNISSGHALQETSGNRPTHNVADDYPLIRFLGSSSQNLLTPRIPGTTGFLMFHGKLTGGSGWRIVAGAVGASGTDRLYLGFDTDNKAMCRVGTGDEMVGADDLLDDLCTIAVRWNGSTVDFFVNGVQEDTQTQAGATSTTTPLRLGAYNENGTASSFFTGDGYDFLQGDFFPTDAEIAGWHAGFFL